MEIPLRRTIEELIARYCLEPELRDLYVEGPSDKKLFEWFLKRAGCKAIMVFEIDSIDIKESLIKELNLQSGNRDRVIALAIEFERCLQKDAQFLLCVADSDFDFLLGKKYNSRYLLYTDYTSVELYFFSKYIIEKLLVLGIQRVPCKITELVENFIDVLQEVFLIRAANEKIGWGLHWLCFTGCCRIEKNIVIFNREEFIRRYLSKNGRSSDIKKFIEVCRQLEAIKVETFKHRIRGHDYLKLIGWYISKQISKGGHKFRDPEIIRAMILPAVDENSLMKEKLFKNLTEKYS